jgi:fibronectin type 3 domain-containing protein/lysophospholipase L1-like esterase
VSSSVSMFGRRMAARSAVLFLLATSFAVLAASPAEAASFITPTRIMPMGDSITWGTGGNGGGGYRPPLVQTLVAGRYSSDMVGSQRSGPALLYDRDHEGYRGYRIDQLAAAVPNQLTTYRPEFILLQIGTNDVLQQFELEAAPARLSALIDLITDTRPSARLIVASITPLADPALDALARAYNAEIPGLVGAKAAEGRQVSFLDMYPVITTADLADGVHPNQGGYDKMAAAWSTTLAAMRDAPPPVSNRPCPCSVWDPGDAPAQPQVASTTSAEVGVKFRTEKDGFIAGVRFYKGTGNTGTHIGSLWTATGSLLAEATFTDETSSGWQEVSFAQPVPVQAHTVYIASYYAPVGRYAADVGYFREREVVNSPLRLPSQGAINGNGVIRGGHGFPIPGDPSPQHDTNYWVDVVFTSNTPPPSPPPAPATLTATAVSTSQVDLSWSAVAEATGYRVERSTDTATWNPVANTAAGETSHSDTGLAAGTTYSYRVVATNDAGDSPPSPVATATTDSAPPSPPPAPATLTATAVSASQVDLSWSAVAEATGYRVERSTETATWNPVANTAAGETSYSDTGLAAGTTYSYRVVATNDAGDSPPSPVATATTGSPADTTAPTAPFGLKAASAKAKINLSWSGSTDAGGSGLAGYIVWRSTAGASGPFTAVATTASTSYSDTTVASKASYWYQVTAFDGAGNQSQPSNVVSARPK